MDNIILNLLSTACKFTPENGQVEISLSTGEDTHLPQNAPLRRYVELTVADSGIGIASTEREHIFERFYQIRNSQNNSNIGTGLGQVHPHLGMLVEVPAVPDHLFIQRLSALKIIHTMYSPFRSPVPTLGKMDHPDLPHPVQHPGAQDAQGDAGQDGDAAVDWCDEHVD